MGWILEASRVKEKHFLKLAVVASNWCEVSASSLAERRPAKVANQEQSFVS